MPRVVNAEKPVLTEGGRFVFITRERDPKSGSLATGGIMARKKLARRFDPRGGVSQSMVDAESRYVAKELEDYLLLSITDLRDALGKRQRSVEEHEDQLQQFFAVLADRERLALRCMLARDISHIAALYIAFMTSTDAPQTTGATCHRPEEQNEQDEPRPALPFNEWLFEH